MSAWPEIDAVVAGDSGPLKAPFPWFGGKRRVADRVWSALGDVDNYVEPFMGSLAVLLGRPAAFNRWQTGAETVNDADAYLSNFWRAVTADPEAVAAAADWPVNETDNLARHLWLVNEGRARIGRMEADPDFYDVKVAAWWVWGINAWIGGGWCHGTGPWTRAADGLSVVKGDAGQGVNRQLPHLGDAGQGVNRQLPHLGNAGQGVMIYFQSLAARLRRVRVCCGDWSRVVTDGATAYGESVGVFLDPPYLGDVRAADLYRVDDHTISVAVRDWAIAHGDDRRLRIVLAGYWQEHAAAMPDSWRSERYSANKSFGTRNAVGSGAGNDANRHNEALWYSAGCRKPQQAHLFGGTK